MVGEGVAQRGREERDGEGPTCQGEASTRGEACNTCTILVDGRSLRKCDPGSSDGVEAGEDDARIGHLKGRGTVFRWQSMGGDEGVLAKNPVLVLSQGS